MDWHEQIIRDLFGILKSNGYRQFNTAYIEIPKKNGKSELAAAVALLLTCGDGEQRAEVYGAAADRQQASIVFDVAAEEYGSEFYANGASPSGVLEHPGTLDEEGGNLYLVNGSMTKLSGAGAFAEKNNEKEENTNGEKVLELEKIIQKKIKLYKEFLNLTELLQKKVGLTMMLFLLIYNIFIAYILFA